MTLRKLRRIFLIFLISVTGVLALLFATLNLPFSQRFATRKVNQSLVGSKVPIHIDDIRRIFPNSVVIHGVLIKDLQGDTVIYADKLDADIRLLALTRKKVVLQHVNLSQARVRLLTDEQSLQLNIAEAFTAGRPGKGKNEGKAKAFWTISIQDGTLTSLHFQMTDSISGIHILQDMGEIGIKGFSLDLEEREIRAHTLELRKASGYVHLANNHSNEPESNDEEGKPWNLALLNLDLGDIDFTFDQNQGEFALQVALGKGEIRAKKMDLLSRVMDIKEISLAKGKAIILSSIQEDNPISPPQADSGKEPWFLKAKDIALEEMDVHIGKDGSAGADSLANKTRVLGIEMKLKDFILDPDRLGLKIRRLSFALGNGFSMKQMQGSLDSDSKSTELDIDMETPYSQLSLEGKASQSYAEILSGPAGIHEASLAIRKGSLSVKDVYPFLRLREVDQKITALDSKPYVLTGHMKLMESILSISEFSFSQNRNFLMSLEGQVAHPFPISKAEGELKLAISDVNNAWLNEVFTGIGLGISLPGLTGLTLQSHLSSSMDTPVFDLVLNSSLGKLSASGSMDFTSDSFSIQSAFDQLVLGEFLDVPDLGSFTGSLKLKGQGFSPEVFHSELMVRVDSFVFKDYAYTHTHLEGLFQPGEYEIHLGADDPHLAGDLVARFLPSDSASQIHASGTIGAQLGQLKLMKDTLSVLSSFNANITRRNHSLESHFSAFDIVLSDARQSIDITKIETSFDTDSVNTALQATSDFFNLDVEIAKPFSELSTLGKYYRDYLITFTDPQHINASSRVMALPEINATGRITNHEAFDIILRDTGFHITNLDFALQHHVSENRINYGLNGRGVKYKMVEIDSLDALVSDSAGEMNLRVFLDETSLYSGPGNNWLLSGSFANWRSLIALSVHNPRGQLVYDLHVAARADSSYMVVEIPSKSLILNRKQWQMESPDLLSLDLSDQTISPALRMYTDSSYLQLYESAVDGIPAITLELNQVEMETLMREDLFPGRPDASISGSLALSFPGKTGKKVVSDLQLSQVEYSDLSFDQASLTGYLEYDSSGNYSMDMEARLDSAQLTLKGLRTDFGERQISSKIHRMPINTLQPFTRDFLSDLRGYISGEFDVSNASGSDRVDGQLSFQGVQLRINALNSTFRLPDQGLFVEDEKLLFKQFKIRDTLNNALLVDGFLDFQNVHHIYSDLNISSSKLQVMSRGSEEEDTPFYGNVFVDSKFSVKGPLENPSIKGNILLSRGTEVFYQHVEDLSISGSQKILTFESSSDTLNPVQIQPIKRQSEFIKSSLETIVEIDPSTLINVSLSKKIYDLELQIKGGGRLNYNMLNNNQMSLSGSYEIGEGAAELKLVGWPKKSFRIEEGGYIRWDGRVEDPTLSFRALNRVSSSYLNPMDGQQRPVDLDVVLQLTEHISDLDVLFTVNTGDQYLMSIINTLSPEEKMRQAISILLFEVIDLPGISTSSNYMSQQVNSILASQLNQITQSAIKGVDISFGIDTYTSAQSGGDETNTSLSYEVRKSLLNDRAHIEVSGRLRDMNQSAGATNNALNNISLEYSLDSAATRFLKVYNEHSYEDVFEGEVIKTGIGYYVRKRHRHLRDIWKREKKGKKGKKERKTEE